MKPVRLLAEILLIMAMAEISIMLVLPVLIPNASPWTEALLNVAMLVCLCAPVVYWRFTHVFKGIDKDVILNRAGKSQSGRAAALTALAQAAGLLLTAGGVWWQSNKLDEQAQYQFDRAAERTESEVLQRLNQSVSGLNGAKGAMAAHPNFGRREFRAYVGSRHMATEFPGVRGFSFIERVQRTDLPAFMARERADGAPAFTVRTSGSAPELLVIKYIEPLAANLAAMGFDVAQEPVRRLAAERAIDTGEPALTGLIELVQDDKKKPGFLYFVPVYKSGTSPQSPLERRRDLVGLLSAPIVAAELFERATVVSDHMVDFELYEGNVIRPWKLIYRSSEAPDVPAGVDTAQPRAKYSVDDVVFVGSQALTLRAYASPRFTAAQDRSSLLFIGVGGVLLSLLVATTVWLLAVGRQRAQAMAEAMTDELGRMAQVVQHTGSAVAIMDRQMHILWVNQGFTRITGYALEETLGKTPAELLSSNKSDPEAVKTLRDSVDRAVACRVELVNRARDERNYWVDVELQPTFDAQNNHVGFMEISTDITQSKHTQHQLETALREADAILSTVRTHAIVSETDRCGIILSVNDAFCDISGYSREELIGRNHSIINSGVHPPDFWAEFWQTIGRGRPWRGEICNLAKDGSLYWVDSMIAPFVGANGEIEKFVSIRIDITARRQAADRLGRSEATFSAMFSQSSTAMALLSMTGRTMKINAALCDLLGYSQDDLMELTLADVSHPDEWDVDRLQDARLFTGEMERYQRVKRYMHRDGQVVWGLASVSVVRAAEAAESFIIVQIVDITARKRAEEALNVSNALMEESQAIAKVGGWELDVESGALYWTHETYRIHEASPDDFNPTVDAGVGYFLPESRERITQAMQAALERGEGYDLELQTYTTQGHLIDVRTTGTATVEDGKTVRVSGIFQDITQRKQYERSLLEARAVAELATQSKGQFLANMSHEIRTPMNAILGMLKLLGNTTLSHNQLDYVRKTEGAARSLLGLINDILDFSKIDAGKMELDQQPFRVDRLMRDLAVVLTANVGTKPIEVLYDLDPALPASVLGDAMRVQQVLINLAGNAVKFTAAGQVVISLQRVPVDPQTPGEQGPLAEANEADVALIRFAVKDSGIGIAPENQAKIFSGFSQAEASTSRRFGGTGLGLAISQRLVQVMGGQISIESQLGVGSTFSFTLRLPVVAQTYGAPEVAAPLPAQRVLVMDDNAVSSELMAKMMRAFGWDVTLAQGGQAGLDLIASRASDGVFPFDCVYVDWQMPGMDGWDTLQRVRALYQTLTGPAPRLIMLSASSRDDLSQRTQAEQDQLNAFLLKPVTASMLFDAALTPATGKQVTLRAPRSSQRQLAGMRVLVVEDNAINQQVAEELLSFEGALVSIAADGRQGVNAVASASKQFDAVLMDIQMPVMDGYAATRMIRDKLGLRQLPIIGLTANAMASDRDACLLAGMNEHLGKPFDMAQLVALLLRLTGFQARPGAPAPDVGRSEPQAVSAQTLVATAPPGLAPEKPEVAEMDLPAALERMGGLKPLYLRAARELQKTLASFPQDLAAVVQADDWAAARGLLHTLKGNAGTLGLTRLAVELAGLEAFSQSQPTPTQGEARLLALASGIQVAEQALAQAIEQVGAALGQASPAVTADPAPAQVADKAACQAVVARLIPLLQASDLSVLSLFAEARPDLADLAEAQLEALEAALQNLDLDAALAVCQAIMAD